MYAFALVFSEALVLVAHPQSNDRELHVLVENCDRHLRPNRIALSPYWAIDAVAPPPIARLLANGCVVSFGVPQSAWASPSSSAAAAAAALSASDSELAPIRVITRDLCCAGQLHRRGSVCYCTAEPCVWADDTDDDGGGGTTTDIATAADPSSSWSIETVDGTTLLSSPLECRSRSVAWWTHDVHRHMRPCSDE
jgi:hypothetical protein